jgi:hypothetical protein
MTGNRVIPFASFLLIAAVPLAGTILTQDPPRRPVYAPPERQPPQSQPQPQNNQSAVETFAGKISMVDGKYVLENQDGNKSYILDDQKKARKYEGKSVLVTGTLDSTSNTIHVRKIEATA